MAQHKIDSWNTEQLSRLRRFFAEEAKPGDTVIFDRRLAENNVPPHEGLDENNCNSWVYNAANLALNGLASEKIETLANSIILTTAYLHAQYPQPPDQQKTPEPPGEDYFDDDDDWELELDLLPAKQGTKTDADAEEWAKVKARYNSPDREPA